MHTMLRAVHFSWQMDKAQWMVSVTGYVSSIKSCEFQREGSPRTFECCCEVGHLNHDLNHYTDPSIEHYFTKFNIYTSLAAKELDEKGNKLV